MSVLGFIQMWRRRYVLRKTKIGIYIYVNYRLPYRYYKKYCKEVLRRIWVAIFIMKFFLPIYYHVRIWFLLSPLNRLWYRPLKIAREFHRYLYEAEMRLITGTHWKDITLWDSSMIKGVFGLVTQKSGERPVAFIHKNFFWGSVRDFFLTMHRIAKYDFWWYSNRWWVWKGRKRCRRRATFYLFLKRYYVKYKAPIVREFKQKIYRSSAFRSIFYPNNQYLTSFLVLSCLFQFITFYCNLTFVYFYLVIYEARKRIGKIILLLNKCHRYMHWKYILLGDISFIFNYQRYQFETTIYDFIKCYGYTSFLSRIVISLFWRYIHLIIWFYLFCIRFDFGFWLGCFLFDFRENFWEYWRLESRANNILYDIYNQEVEEWKILNKMTGYRLRFYNKKDQRWEKMSRWDDYTPIYNAKLTRIFNRIFFTDITQFFCITVPYCLLVFIYAAKVYLVHGRRRNRLRPEYIFLNTKAGLLARDIMKQFMVTTPILDELITEGCIAAYVEEMGIADIVLDGIVEEDLLNYHIADLQAEEVVDENIDDFIDEFIDDFVRERSSDFLEDVHINRYTKRFVWQHKIKQQLRDIGENIEVWFHPDRTDVKYLKRKFKENNYRQIRLRIRNKRVKDKEAAFRQQYNDALRKFAEERYRKWANRPLWKKILEKLDEWFFWWQYW